MDCRAVGLVITGLGGNRATETDAIDPAVGLTEIAPVGEPVGPDRPLALVHARDESGADAAAAALRAGDFDFAFVYLGSVDVAGHTHGWMSEGYLAQITRVDRALGSLLDALPAGATVLLQSDHGGHARDHGTDMPEDLTIPWLVAGPRIRQGYTIEVPVSLLDTAPTIVELLGLTAHPKWEGRCVEEVFAG
jgi:phosphopentomutase